MNMDVGISARVRPQDQVALVHDPGGRLSSLTMAALPVLTDRVLPVVRRRAMDADKGASHSVHRHWAGALDLFPSMALWRQLLPLTTGTEWRVKRRHRAVDDQYINPVARLHAGSRQAAPSLAMVRCLNGSGNDHNNGTALRGARISRLEFASGPDILRDTAIEVDLTAVSEDATRWRPAMPSTATPSMIGPVRVLGGTDPQTVLLVDLKLALVRQNMRPLFGFYATTPFGIADHGLTIDLRLRVIASAAMQRLFAPETRCPIALEMAGVDGVLTITLPSMNIRSASPQAGPIMPLLAVEMRSDPGDEMMQCRWAETIKPNNHRTKAHTNG